MAEASVVGAGCSVASFGTAEDDVEKVFHSDLARHLCDSERGVWGCVLFQLMFYFKR
jgi:hypothetical protein